MGPLGVFRWEIMTILKVEQCSLGERNFPENLLIYSDRQARIEAASNIVSPSFLVYDSWEILKEISYYLKFTLIPIFRLYREILRDIVIPIASVYLDISTLITGKLNLIVSKKIRAILLECAGNVWIKRPSVFKSHGYPSSNNDS